MQKMHKPPSNMKLANKLKLAGWLACWQTLFKVGVQSEIRNERERVECTRFRLSGVDAFCS